MNFRTSISAVAFAMAFLSHAAVHAEDAAAADAAADDSTGGESAIIVTGTRTTGMKAADSPAPIQLLGNDALTRTGQPDLIQSLAQNLPSVQAEAFGSDLQAHTLQMKLRGLSPNHTLVLVNGKRRHGTANVAVSGGPYGGGAAADTSFIISQSIDHVEVLQDGAAAQYGTDAIAGVINFIMKKKDHGGSIDIDGGGYYDQGGKSYTLTGNIGMAPFDGAYLNITAQKKHHGFSFRGDINPQVYGDNATAIKYLSKYPELVNLPDYPYTNRIEGDPQVDQTVVSYDAGYDWGNFEVYSFGSYGHKKVRAYENTRTPDVIVAADGTPFYPAGFQPLEASKETDYSFTGGFKGEIADTTFDIASTFGKDWFGVYVENSGNASLYKDTGFTPTNFHNGDFIATQWSTTLDLTHAFDIGLSDPLNVAAGLEYRRETYQIVSGDPASYYGNGAQSFFGYSPNDAGFHSRKNYSEYIDVSLKPTENWIIDGAVRHEYYNDFGNTTVFKLTTRYDFSPAIAIRGTVSTGFRAPTLAEGFYSGINVGPNFVGGVFPANSASAAALGFGGLKPEKSTNYSIGFVFNPAPRLTVTLDAYSILVRDRIVISSNFYGFYGKYCPPGVTLTGCVAYNADNYQLYNQQGVYDAVAAALGGEIPSFVLTDINGDRNVNGSVGVQTFVNGVRMRTQGIDFVATYSSDFGNLGHVDWSLNAAYNENRVHGISPLPSTLYVSTVDPAKSALLDKYSVVQLEHSTPAFRATAGAYWKIGNFAMNLRESYYSSVYSLGSTPGNSTLAGADLRTYVNAAVITDLDLSYQIAPPVRISIGANNLFNHYPTKTPDIIRDAYLASGSRSYSTSVYPTISPYGINGGYYYAKLNLTF